MNQRQNETQNKAPVQAVSEELYTNASCGLSRKEARSRFRAIGRNTLFDRDSARKKPFWYAIIRDPSVLFFLFIVFLAFFFAPLSVGIVTVLAFLCSVAYPLHVRLIRTRNERVFDLVRMPRVDVIRDGRLARVRADRIVPGDLVSLKTGDIVPADCRLIAADRLRVLSFWRDDEGNLLRKIFFKKALPQELVSRSVDFDNAEDLLRGVSEILEGEALAVVLATGDDTCWRIEQCGDAPTEYHRAQWDAGYAERAADHFLNLYILIQFVAFFVLALVSVLFYPPDEVDVILLFLSLSAMVCLGAVSVLSAYLCSFEVKWCDARMKSQMLHERAVLKSNQIVDRLTGVTDLLIVGREAHSLLHEDLSSTHGFSALLNACGEQGIRLTVFFDDALTKTDGLNVDGSFLIFNRKDIADDRTLNLVDYIEKYRVFCGVERENIRSLTVALRRQKRHVAVMSERAEDIEMLMTSSLAIGVADLSALMDVATANGRDTQATETSMPSSALLRHTDLLLSPTTRSGSAVSCFLSLRRDADAIVTRGMASFRFLFLSQLIAFSYVLFSCVFGVGLPSAFYLLFGVGAIETVGILWIESLSAPLCRRHTNMMGTKQLKRILSDRLTWLPPVTASLVCVVFSLILRLFGAISVDEASSFLFASLLFLQLCVLLLSAAQAGFEASFGRMLLPVIAVLLPILILTAFCVAFDGLDTILQIGDWSIVTFCALWCVPVFYFLLHYLFLMIFHRTAK